MLTSLFYKCACEETQLETLKIKSVITSPGDIIIYYSLDMVYLLKLIRLTINQLKSDNDVRHK